MGTPHVPQPLQSCEGPSVSDFVCAGQDKRLCWREIRGCVVIARTTIDAFSRPSAILTVECKIFPVTTVCLDIFSPSQHNAIIPFQSKDQASKGSGLFFRRLFFRFKVPTKREWMFNWAFSWGPVFFLPASKFFWAVLKGASFVQPLPQSSHW